MEVFYLLIKSKMYRLLSSESVTPWHPDKICDRISDAILGACLEQDPNARVACECFITTDTVVVGGEISCSADIDIPSIVRKQIVDIWYDSEVACFDGNNCTIINLVHTQSPDIAVWVDSGGAGDQWLMYWYATDETDVYMPLTIHLAHRLSEKLTQVRLSSILDYLLPDGKTQVTVSYDEQDRPKVHAVVLSTQHLADVSQEKIHKDIISNVIKPVLGDLWHDDIVLHINPTGIFTIGWPIWDTGLTGRKIIVDTYGGIGRHGGGAFSGKDPTKVDRSGAYMARYLAKNIVASRLANRCEIQISYAIGVAQPLGIYLDCFGTAKVDPDKIVKLIYDQFDLSPRGIISKLDLTKQKYIDTTAFWHFWREWFSWERLDSVWVFESLLWY